MSGVTIADIQAKIVAKFDEKYKGGMTKNRLERMFREADKNNDGFITLPEFVMALEQNANALSDDEASFLFQFWDTMAGQQEPQGAVQTDLAVNDLLSSQPEYTTGFRSGAEGFRAKQAKGNLPSQQGGIFGGGSYEADAEGQLDSYRQNKPAQPAPSMGGGSAAQPSNRPKGNQSSIEGGIFGGMDAAPPPSSRSDKGNRSNQSSIQGGIFGEAPPSGPHMEKKFNSNRSSIPGGIFG